MTDQAIKFKGHNSASFQSPWAPLQRPTPKPFPVFPLDWLSCHRELTSAELCTVRGETIFLDSSVPRPCAVAVISCWNPRHLFSWHRKYHLQFWQVHFVFLLSSLALMIFWRGWSVSPALLRVQKCHAAISTQLPTLGNLKDTSLVHLYYVSHQVQNFKGNPLNLGPVAPLKFSWWS